MNDRSRRARYLTLALVLAGCGSASSNAAPGGAGDGAATLDGGPAATGAEGGVAEDAGEAGLMCAALGHACSDKSTCCSAFCHGNVCTCNADGYACTTNDDCCKGDCLHGTCGGSDASSSRSPGALAASFGARGCTTVAYAGNEQNASRPFDAAVDAAGNTFVVGDTFTTGISGGSASGWFVALGPSGGGLANVAIPTTFGSIYALALAPSGAPTLFGDGFGTGTTRVMRTSAAGVADPSYALSTGSAAFSGFNLGVHYQSSGALVVSSGSVLTRFDPAGALDATFGAQGTVTVATATSLASADGFVIDASDRIYVAGGTSAGHWAVARLAPGGTLDASFGVNGVIDAGPRPRLAGSSPAVAVRASRSGGDVFLVGREDDANVSYSALRIVHVAAGNLDPTWGGGRGHVVATGPSSPDPTLVFADAAVQDDGKLVLAGRDGLGVSWYLTRLTTAGVVESAYGNGGWVVTSANAPSGGPGTTAYTPVRVVLASDGGAIVVQQRQYVHNLYDESNAIVCKYTP